MHELSPPVAIGPLSERDGGCGGGGGGDVDTSDTCTCSLRTERQYIHMSSISALDACLPDVLMDIHLLQPGIWETAFAGQVICFRHLPGPPRLSVD